MPYAIVPLIPDFMEWLVACWLAYTAGKAVGRHRRLTP